MSNIITIEAQDFLNTLFSDFGFELAAKAEDEDGCVIDMDGHDASLLRSESGELLDSVEHLINQVFSRRLDQGQRLICDVHSFRAIRETELQAMARHAAERVRSTRLPFTFGAMNANERRIIHLTLAKDTDLQTESIGEGSSRRLRVILK